MVEQPKSFKTYEEQVDLLIKRGMCVADRERAVEKLRRINYYRLSGYWYPFRMRKPGENGRSDRFLSGTTFDDVVSLYDFDARLRVAVLAVLAPVELSMRALVGHVLGEIDPCIHLKADLLGPVARGKRASEYAKWLKKYQNKLKDSREDFVRHHKDKYGGTLPVWAAVEVLDWGMLAHLYSMSPRTAQNKVANVVNLTSPQLESWLTALNIVRNIAAHHGRMYNRVYGQRPKLPRMGGCDGLLECEAVMNRVFGQLTLVQYLLKVLNVGSVRLLPATLMDFPDGAIVSLRDTGAPEEWKQNDLWKF